LDSSATELQSSSRRFQIRFDGKFVASIYRPFHPSSPFDLSLGYNATGCTGVGGIFTGPLLRAERMGEFPAMNVPLGGWGAIRLVCSAPANPVAASEPLIVTGKPGIGDFIFIQFESSTRARLGHDHWGMYATYGESFEIDPTRPFSVVVSLSAFYPPMGDAGWSATSPDDRQKLLQSTWVEVNGKRVLENTTSSYPCTPEQIYVGRNPIGGSTCSAAYTGTVHRVERLGLQ
jgi:hypothetical protein